MGKVKNSVLTVFSLVLFIGTGMYGYNQNVKIKRIWNKSPHAAFTGLVHYEGSFYCSFREAKKHVDKYGNDNGVIRILKSENGKKWETFDIVAKEGLDFRDAMLSITPDGKLMLLMGASVHQNNATLSICSHVAFASKDSLFTEAVPIEVNYEASRKWLWKIQWYKDTAYGFVYGDKFCLVKSSNGISYETIQDFNLQGSPSEADLCFAEDGIITAIIRRAKNINGLIGTSNPPYIDWQWTDCGYEMGGPDIVTLSNNKKVISSRFISEKGNRIMVFVLQEDNSLRPVLQLPAGGDCSYSDALLLDGTVYMSYYSSHRRKASIYFAVIPELKLNGEIIE
ncbi:MAG: hypothetical protein KBA86_06160 [Bacteroidales bacterium]|nr:hypothetical protein [Bacteroidales bacterium]